MAYIVPRAKPPRGTLLTVALILVILAFILLVAGFVAPGWSYSSGNVLGVDFETHAGLWFSVICIGGNCDSGYSGDAESLTKYRAMTTVSLVFAIIAIIIVAIIRRPSTRGIKGFGALVCFISGVLAIVAAAMFGDDVRKTDELFGEASPIKFPYALFLFGLGGVVIFIAFIFILIETCRSPSNDGMVYEKREYVQERQVPHADPYPVKYQEPQQYRNSQYDPQVIRTSQMQPQQQVVYTHAPVHYVHPQQMRYYEQGYSQHPSRASRSQRADHVISIGGL